MPTSFESSGPTDDDHHSWKATVANFVIAFVTFLLFTNVLRRGDSALSIATAHGLLHDAIIIVAWAVAIVVQFQGAWLRCTTCWNAGTRPNIDTSPGWVWSLRDPQIISGFRALVESGSATALWTACTNADRLQLP
jgi:hypothetical protein